MHDADIDRAAVIAPPPLIYFFALVAGLVTDWFVPFSISPTTALVTDVPYRFSRNPVYVALTMLYLGIGCLLNSGWALLMTVPALIVMHFRVIHAEESYLPKHPR